MSWNWTHQSFLIRFLPLEVNFLRGGHFRLFEETSDMKKLQEWFSSILCIKILMAKI